MRFLKMRRAYWLLLCIGFLTIFCTACGSVDTIFTVVQAALAGVGIVLTGLGALIAPSEATAVNGVVTAIGDGVSAVKAAFDAYEASPSTAGLLAALQAAVATLQAEIPTLLAGLNVTNVTLTAWITTLVGLVGKLISTIATDILPALPAAAKAHAAGNNAPLTTLKTKFDALTAQFVIDHDAALAASGLPPAVISSAQKHFNSAKAHHIGPIRV